LRGAVWGGAATLFMTLFMATGLGWAQIPGQQRAHPYPRLVAAHLLGRTHGAGPILLGMVVHFVYGSLMGLAFAYFSRPMTIAKGVGFGLFFWFVMQVIVLPWLGLSQFGGHTGGVGLASGTLLLHLIYGVTLGFLGARDDNLHRATFDDLGRLEPATQREVVT
jgi:hypothetical protein